MFKFKIIKTQKEVVTHKIAHAMALGIKTLNESPPWTDMAFFSVDDKDKGVLGGAILIKRKLREIQTDVRELVRLLAYQEGYIWECSGIYGEVEVGGFQRDVEPVAKDFYHDLYEALAEFAHKEGMGFVVMRISAESYEDTKTYGHWPYVAELSPSQSLDGLFHGILPLSGSQYESYHTFWEISDQINVS